MGGQTEAQSVLRPNRRPVCSAQRGVGRRTFIGTFRGTGPKSAGRVICWLGKVARDPKFARQRNAAGVQAKSRPRPTDLTSRSPPHKMALIN